MDSLLERIALAASLAILVAGLWFWSEQIQDVIETLKLAYG